MSDNKKLSPSLLMNIILFGFMGQVAWAVENNFFNLYMLKIGGDMHDISVMIAVSAIVAFLTTLFMGSLSDKINKRKIFICAGYILWGISIWEVVIEGTSMLIFFRRMYRPDALPPILPIQANNL